MALLLVFIGAFSELQTVRLQSGPGGETILHDTAVFSSFAREALWRSIALVYCGLAMLQLAASLRRGQEVEDELQGVI